MGLAMFTLSCDLLPRPRTVVRKPHVPEACRDLIVDTFAYRRAESGRLRRHTSAEHDRRMIRSCCVLPERAVLMDGPGGSVPILHVPEFLQHGVHDLSESANSIDEPMHRLLPSSFVFIGVLNGH